MASQTDHLTAASPSAADPPVPGTSRRWRRWRRPLVIAAVVAVGAAAAAVPATIAYGADVARGVSVLGVDIGGHSKAAAERVLRARLADRVAEPVPVTVGEVTASVDPVAAGLTLDIPATVAKAARVRPAPWTALLGTRRVEPVVSVDVDKLDGALQPHVGMQGIAPVWPAIRYDGLEPRAVAPVSGRGLDRHRTARAFARSWLRTGRIDLPITDVVPASSRADLDSLILSLARPAVAAPVTMSVGATDVEIPPAAIAASLTFDPDADGKVTPRVDPALLRQALGAALAPAEAAPVNATFTVQNGQPVEVPQTDGRAVDLDRAASDLLAVLPNPAPRHITAGLVAKPADRTLETLHGMGIVELVSTFTTKFVPGQPRTRNIRIVADLARGRIVPAGGTFSLNELTGERTLAKGYVMAPVIEGGKLKNGPGGGISQFATTAFNAGYYAGMVDVAHKPHSYYFDRYPAVIESTTIYPTVDMAFRNDSPNAILIDTVWTENSITVSIFGTRRYEIETVYGPRTNVTSPPAIPLDEPDCIPTDGLPGFRQEAWRVFKQNGVEIKRERFQWHYRAEPKFVC
jgi:vancomycin resistance protein YoaR